MDTNKDKALQLLESKIESLVRAALNERGEAAQKTKNSNVSDMHRDRNHQLNNDYLSQRKKSISKDRIASKRGDDTVQSSDTYKKQYKAIEKALNDSKVDATGVMAIALGFDPKDDSARSHAFKKLHKEKTQDGTGNYSFDQDEVAKIFNALP